MQENAYDWNTVRMDRKRRRVVGDVIGKYHPHGDHPFTMLGAALAQNFSIRGAAQKSTDRWQISVASTAIRLRDALHT